MKIFKRFIAAGLIFSTLSGAAVELLPVEKSPVIVFINGKKYYVHTVKSGDTLYSIAKAYEVDDTVISFNVGVGGQNHLDGLFLTRKVDEGVVAKLKLEQVVTVLQYAVAGVIFI